MEVMGVITTGIDRRIVDDELAQLAIRQMRQLNNRAMEAMVQVGVHACTDVSGFGFLGHLHEMAAASGVSAQVSWEKVPILRDALELVESDCIPDGTRNNMDYLEGIVDWDTTPREMTVLLSDAQTSGGLLIAVPKQCASDLLNALSETQTPGVIVGQIQADLAGKIQVIA